MSTRKFTVVATIAAIATVTMAAGCTNNASASESKRFPFSGKTLLIDGTDAAIHVEPGGGDEITVDRTLTGDATGSGNASWELTESTLKLNVTCSSMSVDCAGSHTVKVPDGVAVELKTSGGAVELAGVAGDVTANLTNDSSLKIVGSSGNLNLNSGGGKIELADSRSKNVVAKSSADGSVALNFAAAPERVEAVSTGGSARVTLPKGPETYRVDAQGSSPSVPSDPSSGRTVTVRSSEGRASVDKAS